jgi:hypothetical protein
MKLKLKIDRYTTTEELTALAALFVGLSGSRTMRAGEVTGADYALANHDHTAVFSPPADAAELNEPEGPVVVNATSTDPLAQGEAPKRRRRTKAEIEAAAAAEPGTTVATTTTDPDPHQTLVEQAAEKATAIAEDAAGNVQPPVEEPAHTQTANATDTKTEVQETAASTPVTESHSDGKTYTHADVQKLAVDAARRFGPEKVKGLIAEYPHAAKIADLTAGDLPSFVAKLNTLA